MYCLIILRHYYDILNSVHEPQTNCMSRKVSIIYAFEKLSPDQKNVCRKSDIPHNQLIISISVSIHKMCREILLFKKKKRKPEIESANDLNAASK